MSARVLSQLLYHAETAHPAERDPLIFGAQCGLELEASLCNFLWYLTDPGRDHKKFAQACNQVMDNSRLTPFWRALAAVQRGQHLKRNRGWPRTRDGYFARALALMAPVWEHPTVKWRVNPDAAHIYHLRMQARGRLCGAQHELGMLVIGAECFVENGWFDAPSWTQEACRRLVDNERDAEARSLLKAFTTRALEAPCFFSREQRAQLMGDHGALLAA